jgi:hypothetical protein
LKNSNSEFEYSGAVAYLLILGGQRPHIGIETHNKPILNATDCPEKISKPGVINELYNGIIQQNEIANYRHHDRCSNDWEIPRRAKVVPSQVQDQTREFT